MTKISEKLIAEHKKIKLNKIIDLVEIRSANKKLDKINSDLSLKLDSLKADPNHKVYSSIQNQLSYFAEEFSIHSEFSDYYDKIEEIDDEYMPSFPPGSPLTGSYFTYWAFCDMRFGKEKETINTIFSDIGNEFKFEELILKGLSNLNRSSMKFYKHLGFDNDLIILMDLITNKTYSCVCTSGYKGEKNEIWYIRLVPNLDKIFDYYVTLTTPYVIINYSEKAWLDFFKRQGIKKGEKDYEIKYFNFMKHHKNFKYWHNYIMDGYYNYRPNCIYLTGIPDIKGSKPHEIDL